jgi:acyl transferase domain-containing protein
MDRLVCLPPPRGKHSEANTVSEPVAVVGMACRFPGAENLDEYWNLIRTGRVATAPVSPQRWRHAWLYAADDPRAADFAYTDIVAHLPDVDSFPVEHYPLAPRRLEVTDPQHRLMIVLTDDALRDSGLTALPNRRTDVYIGASAAEYRDLLTARLRARQMAAGEFGTPPATRKESMSAAAR